MKVSKQVCGFAFGDDDSKVVLIKKKKPLWQRDRYNGVGGKVEKFDKTLEDAMVREFCEETGVLTKAKDWQRFVKISGENSHSNKDPWEVMFFRLFDLDLREPKTTTAEEIAIVSVSELPYWETLPNLRWLIPLALCYSADNDTIISPNLSEKAWF